MFPKSEKEGSLFELSKARKIYQKTKDRASAIRLLAMGWKLEIIVIYLKLVPRELA
ncbi:MAG: hypothetical protein JJP05_06100 [cyanobacterium endosymbiont of Rhopalodia gibba]|jgi:hypothetical protein